MTTEPGKILIVEDESNMRKILKALLKSRDHEVLEAGDGREALALLVNQNVEAVLCDIKMPVMDGMDFLGSAVRRFPGLPVIMITAHGSVEGAVNAIKQGAFDYITKPFEQDELVSVLDKALNAYRTSSQRWIESPYDPNTGNILGRSDKIKQVIEYALKVAPTPTTVLITGESGTGKNLVADLIHQQSPRRHKPYIKVNCAAIPITLFESEFFGYEKGAFTGAAGSKPGRFELAHEGTLFLDEIGELPVEIQVKLLQVIQEHRLQRLGGLKVIEVDFRLIAATNRSLEEMIKKGEFREDLYYRLNVFPIDIPPLRERREDIPHLAKHFIDKFSRKLSKEIEAIPSADVEGALYQFDFPGNIRQLENIIERAVLICDGGRIRLSDLPGEMTENLRAGEGVPEVKDAGQRSLKEIVKLKTAQVERDVIVEALKQNDGNVTRTADYLQISRKALQLKMKEYNLRPKKD